MAKFQTGKVFGLPLLSTDMVSSSTRSFPEVFGTRTDAFSYLTDGCAHSGMSRILCCTRSLAQQLLDQGTWDDRLPRSFEITKERFERAKQIPPLSNQRWREAEVNGVAEEGMAPANSEEKI